MTFTWVLAFKSSVTCHSWHHVWLHTNILHYYTEHLSFQSWITSTTNMHCPLKSRQLSVFLSGLIIPKMQHHQMSRIHKCSSNVYCEIAMKKCVSYLHCSTRIHCNTSKYVGLDVTQCNHAWYQFTTCYKKCSYSEIFVRDNFVMAWF